MNKLQLLFFLLPFSFLQAQELRLGQTFPPIKAQTQKEKTIELGSTSKKNKVLYFGFTSCSEVCPNTLNTLAAFLKKHKLDKEIDVLFVSLDWERDTWEKTTEYASYFGKNVQGFSLTKDQLEEVKSKFGIYANKVAEPNNPDYQIDHSSYLYFYGQDNILKIVQNSKDIDDALALKIKSKFK